MKNTTRPKDGRRPLRYSLEQVWAFPVTCSILVPRSLILTSSSSTRIFEECEFNFAIYVQYCVVLVFIWRYLVVDLAERSHQRRASAVSLQALEKPFVRLTTSVFPGGVHSLQTVWAVNHGDGSTLFNVAGTGIVDDS